MYSVKIASTNQQLNSILKLRYEVLRKPWSQTIDSATDQLEEKSINAFIQNNKGIFFRQLIYDFHIIKCSIAKLTIHITRLDNVK